jgi:ribosome-associated protein
MSKFEPYNDDDEIISKTSIKKDMIELQNIGKRLTELPKSKLLYLQITEILEVAILEMHRLKNNEAKRRHLQYIGKLMRSEDIEALQYTLDLMDSSSEVFIRLQKQQELWRERLVKDNDGINLYIQAYPNVDRQQLRTLTRNAQKEKEKEKEIPLPKPHYKKLYQFIRAQDDIEIE